MSNDIPQNFETEEDYMNAMRKQIVLLGELNRSIQLLKDSLQKQQNELLKQESLTFTLFGSALKFKR
jgi:hypothetical protein